MGDILLREITYDDLSCHSLQLPKRRFLACDSQLGSGSNAQYFPLAPVFNPALSRAPSCSFQRYDQGRVFGASQRP